MFESLNRKLFGNGYKVLDELRIAAIYWRKSNTVTC